MYFHRYTEKITRKNVQKMNGRKKEDNDTRNEQICVINQIRVGIICWL